MLQQLLNAAVPKYLEANPIAGLKKLHTTPPAPFRLTREMEARLYAALEPADRVLVMFALDTLARLSDVVNLERRHDHGTHVVLVRPKVAPYKVPVSARLRKALDALPNTGPYYFAHRRQAKNPRDFRSGIKDMLEAGCKRAGIPYGRGIGLTFHGLRHEGASRMLEQGVDVKTVQELGGWTDMRAIQRYLHPTEARKTAAVERIGGDPEA